MAYIDKDAFIAILNAKAEMSLGTPKAVFYNVVKMLEVFPEANVVEVKHGYNKTKNHPVDEFVCSECGFACENYVEKRYDEDGDYSFCKEVEFNYCPNCGLKLDGRSE